MTQSFNRNVWAVVLAGGDGARHAPLTRTADGRAVPKQFCSLLGGVTLLQEALWRAHCVAWHHHVTAIVAAEHWRWWRGSLGSLPRANTIVQPANRGTANGILLSALWIAMRDPLARVVFLPSDHHVADEAPLAETLGEAAAARLSHEALILLGFEPGEPDPELGYIVPRDRRAPLSRVDCFLEKPARSLAVELHARGALWNSFIFAADVSTVIELMRSRHPLVVDSLETALAYGSKFVTAVYETLPMLDFSRDVLQGAEDCLLVRRVPPCGWSDLGTPGRVAACLERLPARRASQTHGAVSEAINLAAECARLRFPRTSPQVNP